MVPSRREVCAVYSSVVRKCAIFQDFSHTPESAFWSMPPANWRFLQMCEIPGFLAHSASTAVRGVSPSWRLDRYVRPASTALFFK